MAACCAILLLLIPARSVAYVLLAALFSIVLVLIHHIFVLMYVPTIAAIVVLRYYLVHGATRRNMAVGIASLAAVGVLCSWSRSSRHRRRCPMTNSSRHLQSRMADPSRTDLLEFGCIWYQPLSRRFADTWARMPSNILGVPVFALLIWLHTPLWRYFARPDRRRWRASCIDGSCIAALVDDQRRLSRDVRDRVRLFALDLELGGLHVPDAACRENAAGVEGRAADPVG